MTIPIRLPDLHMICSDLRCDPAGLAGAEACVFSTITEDSRRVRPGALFVAHAGEKVDGHDFAAQAVEKGAVAVLGDREGLETLAGVPYVSSGHVRRDTGRIAHALAGDPTKRLKVIGVTGTNGKSSVCALIQTVLRHGGHPTANFGTLGYDIGGRVVPAAHTTPFAEDLAALFAEALEQGQTHVVMEVSSHALEQERVSGIHFDAAAFTNLTQDHLDYHGTMAAYQQAKQMLFERIEAQDGFTVVNLDDPAAPDFMAASKAHCITYGHEAACRATLLKSRPDGTTFDLASPWGEAPVHLHLLGRHNVSNALCAAAVCGGLGMPIERVAAGLGEQKTVPGRFEAVHGGQDFTVIVDYAHTDDGLKNVLEAARGICAGRVITVFGCGGDRDKTKRPKMARVAAALSDFCIATSDNPRTEDPHRILLDVEVGLQRASKRKGEDYLVIADRREAIREAVSRAVAGDLVMIAGKGHEDYQILGTERVHFDDREEARAALEARTG